ncbi:piggyBac transposable element-derived protein 3-like [Hydractinia symbiolongicarpus]|uniref:piggyBac transposable element-derived protein 3-like n=1 Tax=Hydractinia symbiolongicarpus TaxID=13093 RepID=UPI00254FBD24|nr:piggyBac transposable element-derived protein 3-like [Hydractinia symbiolongicarpus]
MASGSKSQGPSIGVRSFYGRKPVGVNRVQPFVNVRGIPEPNESSDDDLDSDSENEYYNAANQQDLIIESTSSEYDDSSSDSDDNLALSSIAATSKKTATDAKKTTAAAKKKIPINWKKKNLEVKENYEFKVDYQNELDDDLEGLGSELSYFFYLFPKDLIEDIARQTVLYSVQSRPEKPVDITEGDIQKFIACVLYMSIVKLPSTRDYWSSSIGIPQVAKVMTVNRFEEIKRFIHFSDNATADKTDKINKIRPLVNKLNEQLRTIPIEESLAVDEQIVPFKGRHSIKQYNPKKPHKWGFKVFVLSGVSGFSYNFEVFTGGADNVCAQNEPDLGASSNVVVRLARVIPENCNYKLYVDNWFNSIPLNVYMYTKGIQMVGTVRRNRIGKCPVSSDKEIKKKGRGTHEERVATIDDVDVCVVSWFDNKVVTLLSNFVGSEPTRYVKRFSKKENKHIEIPCPNLVTIYNKHMGGVDFLDSLLGYYRNKIRSKKWYHRIFFHLIDMMVVNAWILWRNQDPNVPLVKFKLAVADLLCHYQKTPNRKRGRPSIDNGVDRLGPKIPMPHQEVRTDKFAHWPVFNDSRTRCKYQKCSTLTYVCCEKCNVALCLNKDRNCFKKFHT